MIYVTTINDKTYTIEINDDHHMQVDGIDYEVEFHRIANQPTYSLIINGQSYVAFISEHESNWQVLLRGRLYEALVEDEREKRLKAAAGVVMGSASGDFNLKAPMPGMVVAVPVSEGLAVKKGDNLIILESMKMQNELKSPREGVVTRIKVKTGDSVEQNQIMVTVSST